MHFRHFATALLLLLGVASASAQSPPLLLGVHPYLDHNEIRDRFSPLADYLSRRLHRSVRVTVGQSYSEHSKAIVNGDVDIAFLGPALYVKLVREQDRFPLLARLEVRGTPTFRGKIITRQDSGIHTLGDLKDRYFAFGSRSSTMSHLLPRYALLQAGVGVEHLAGYRFLGSHDNVALAVLAGDADAGAVMEEVVRRHEPGLLRVIGESDPISEHVFVASRKLPAAQIDLIRKTLLEAHLEPNGAEMLGSIKTGTTALVPARDSDYEDLKIILRKLQALGVSY